MNGIDIDRFLDELRQQFRKQLETTGRYNKDGMQFALELAISKTLARPSIWQKVGP